MFLISLNARVAGLRPAAGPCGLSNCCARGQADLAQALRRLNYAPAPDEVRDLARGLYELRADPTTL